MAYLFEDKEDENQQGQPEQQLGAESAVVSASSKPAAAQAEGSGQYVNLQNYLSANQGANQGEKFAGKLGETIRGAETGQQEAEQGFTQKATSGSVVGDSGLVKKAVERPEEVVSNQDEASRFKAIRDAQYKGPQNLSDDPELYQRAYGSTRKAQEEAGQAGDEYGRFGLLDKYFGSGAGRYDYTKGQQKLDQLLLQNDPRSKQAIAEQQARAQGVGKQYEDLNKRLSQFAGQRKAETEAARREARSAIGIDEAGSWTGGGPIADVVGATERRALERKTKAQQSIPAVEQALRSRDLSSLSPELKKQVIKDTYNPYTGSDSIFNIDPMAYFKSISPEQYTRHSVASPEELSRINALSDLAGLNQTWLDPSQVGSMANAQDFTFDESAFDQAINQNYKNYMAEREGARWKMPQSFAMNLPGAGASSEFANLYGQKELGLDDAKRIMDEYRPRLEQELSQAQRTPGGMYNVAPAQYQQLRRDYESSYGDLLSKISDLETRHGLRNRIKY